MGRMTRRELLEQAGSAAVLGTLLRSGAAAAPAPLPKRRLGRTGIRVPILGLGTAPMADLPQDDFSALVGRALDLGVTYIDTAPSYGPAQEKLGIALAGRRREVFLVSKVGQPSRDEALRQIEQTLRQLRTDRLDLVHMHSFGEADPARWLGPQGMLAGLREAKRQGLVRFLGVSGHNRPGRFAAALETGEVDVLMAAVNYADRHTYGFEEKVLPLARRRKVGIVAMKVLGGPVGFRYNPPADGLLSGARYRGALRYALSQPGVACALIGMKNAEQLQQAVEEARRFRPLTGREQRALVEEGRKLAEEWGAHFGPVA